MQEKAVGFEGDWWAMSLYTSQVTLKLDEIVRWTPWMAEGDRPRMGDGGSTRQQESKMDLDLYYKCTELLWRYNQSIK